MLGSNMPVFAFIIFKDEKEKVRLGAFIKAGFFKSRAGTMLYRFLNCREFRNSINALYSEAGMEIVSLKMPFPVEMLSLFNTKYLEHYIMLECSRNKWNRCFVSGLAEKSGGFELYSTNTDNSGKIFKALLVPILETIYIKSGIRTDCLEITVISGKEASELMSVIKQLEPMVKYINIAATGKEAVEKDIEEFCADSGLAVFVSSDFKSVLRSADLIINLGTAEELSNYRINQGTLVINLSDNDNHKLRGEYNVINGVEYTFKDSMYDALDGDVRRCFSRGELSELLMVFKAGLLNYNDYNTGNNNDPDNSSTEEESILTVFRNSGCRITGFIGRRGYLKPEGIVKRPESRIFQRN